MIYLKFFYSFIYNKKDNHTVEDGIKHFYNQVNLKELVIPENNIEELLKNIYSLNSKEYKELFTMFFKKRIPYVLVLDNIDIINMFVLNKEFDNIAYISEINKQFLSSCHNVVNMISDEIKDFSEMEKIEYFNNIVDNYSEYKDSLVNNAKKLFDLRCMEYNNDKRLIDFSNNIIKNMDKEILSNIKEEVIKLEKKYDKSIKNIETSYYLDRCIKIVKRKNLKSTRAHSIITI